MCANFFAGNKKSRPTRSSPIPDKKCEKQKWCLIHTHSIDRLSFKNKATKKRTQSSLTNRYSGNREVCRTKICDEYLWQNTAETLSVYYNDERMRNMIAIKSTFSVANKFARTLLVFPFSWFYIFFERYARWICSTLFLHFGRRCNRFEAIQSFRLFFSFLLFDVNFVFHVNVPFWFL